LAKLPITVSFGNISKTIFFASSVFKQLTSGIFPTRGRQGASDNPPSDFELDMTSIKQIFEETGLAMIS